MTEDNIPVEIKYTTGDNIVITHIVNMRGTSLSVITPKDAPADTIKVILAAISEFNKSSMKATVKFRKDIGDLEEEEGAERCPESQQELLKKQFFPGQNREVEGS